MNADTQFMPALPKDWPPMATYDEVAKLLRCSLSALYYRVKCGMCPSPVRLGASSRFAADQVQEMMGGVKPRGTYKPTFSKRSKAGRKGGRKAQKNARAERGADQPKPKKKGKP